MDSVNIIGGTPLRGNVHVHGSKNAALPMLAAAVLHKGSCTLHNCPRIRDVLYMEEILEGLGAAIHWNGDTITINCTHVNKSHIDQTCAQKIRASMIFMGALLGRLGEACIPYPGGCVIGKRPIDLHIDVLRQAGAHVEEREGMLFAMREKAVGCEIKFRKKSVGATENAILCTVLSEGMTRLCGCSEEPEIGHLCGMLRAMGADITRMPGGVLEIRGVSTLHDAEYTVPSDRIVAGTYLFAGAATRGQICLTNAPLDEMKEILRVFVKIGGQCEVKGGKLFTDGEKVHKPISYLETKSYPGFPTDLQSPLLAVLATIPGKSHLREMIFEERYKVVPQLNQMGAHITLDGRDALVEGVSKLYGTDVFAQELRGGAALMIAALSAQGQTCIQNFHYIERGYASICEDFRALGGNLHKDTGEGKCEKGDVIVQAEE